MLMVVVCWGLQSMKQQEQEYSDMGFIRMQRYRLERGKERVSIVHQRDLEEKVQGYNPDIIKFMHSPSDRELDFAVYRVSAKKGSVLIHGRKVYDFKETNKQTENQKGSEQKEG